MKPSRLIVVLCLLALCASPVFAGKPRGDAELDPLGTLFFGGYEGYESYNGYDTSGAVPFYYVDQGGCSNSQIRELQAWCSQKAGVMSLNGGGDCTSQGIHYCNADSGGNVTGYSCAITCR